MWFCLTFTICLFPAPVKSLRLSMPGELRFAPHAPSPGWHAVFLLLIITTVIFITIIFIFVIEVHYGPQGTCKDLSPMTENVSAVMALCNWKMSCNWKTSTVAL